jgi:hypothetical protein
MKSPSRILITIYLIFSILLILPIFFGLLFIASFGQDLFPYLLLIYTPCFILSIIIFLQKIKYPIILNLILVFLFFTFIFPLNFYHFDDKLRPNVDFGSYIKLEYEKYELIIKLTQSISFILILINIIIGIILSILWLKNNHKQLKTIN